MNVRRVVWVLALLLPGLAATRAAEPENLAPNAVITSNSEHSEPHLIRFVADGKIPAAACREDTFQAWACRGSEHRNGGATVTFTWPEPVLVAEVVYYGRTAMVWDENWKTWELHREGVEGSVLTGEFLSGHGPQRIRVPEPFRARSITLVFPTSYGGPNPGASEIRVYSASPSDEALGPFVHTPGYVPESPELEAKLRSGELGFDKLVVAHRYRMDPSHVYTYHCEGYRAGGGLYVVDLKTGETTAIVDSPDGQILDCELGYDAREVLFSWKRGGREYGAQFDRCLPPDRDPEHQYRIWRCGIDGAGLTALSDTGSNNMNPCWLPDGGIAFLSDRKPAFAYCFVTTSPVLYRMDGDGSNVRRLSSNYLNDFSPSVLHSGKIIYSRWEYVDRPAIPIQSLWTINPDGTGLSVFFGNRVLDPGTFMQARSIPGSDRVLCTLAAHNGACRGAIAIVDRTFGVNAQEGITVLTPDVHVGKVDRGSGNTGPHPSGGPYETPFPVDSTYYLVSKDGTVLLRDYAGTEQVTVLRPRDGIGWFSPQPVRRRPRPPVRSGPVPPDANPSPYATLFLRDVYKGLDPEVQRGEVVRLAVVQEVEKSRFAPQRSPKGHELAAFGFQFPLVSCGATYAPKKLWGFVDVNPDGSALFKVPAEIPIYFMALDKHGRAVQRMRSFTHLMPGEIQGCVGCHEPRQQTAANSARASAGLASPVELTPPEWGVSGFSFPHVVQPVLDRHCTSCHSPEKRAGGIDLSGDRTDFFNVAYEYLARKGTWGERDTTRRDVPIASGHEGRNPYTSWIATINGTEYNILLNRPKAWGSCVSKLADLVLDGHRDGKGKPRVELPDADRRRIFTWIDLNVPYYHTSSSNYPDSLGCRRLYPADLDAVLADVGKRRCASCHEGGAIPREFYTRIENPERNRFLSAPLATSAGGLQACGNAVFADTDDPDYRAILKTFDAVKNQVRGTPRMDMVQVP